MLALKTLNDKYAMKFLRLNKGDIEIAVNKDSVAYIAPVDSGGTRICFRCTDEKGKLVHKYVTDSFDDVLTMLNAD